MQPTTRADGRRVGFAGLGSMGLGMSLNLLKAGFDVTGYDVNSQALEAFAAAGGHVSSSVADACRDQTRFFVMVASPEQVDSLVFGPDGISVSLPKSAILCLFSTLPPAYVVDLQTRLEAKGRSDIRLLDCPVSGGVVGAKAGTLSIMLGGSDDTIAEVQDELEAISAPGRLFTTGGLGSASTIKMLNQHLAGTHVVAAAEALAFSKALGLSSRGAYTTLMNSEGASWIMGDRGITMLNADWSPPKSAVTIFTKDLGIVKDAADCLAVQSPIASAALQAFTDRAVSGHGRDDDSSVVCNYERITGHRVAEPHMKSTHAVSTMSSSTLDSATVGPVVLITRSNELGNVLEQLFLPQTTQGNRQALQILREGDALDSALSSLAPGSCVGLRNVEKDQSVLQDLSSGFPHLEFFDYAVMLSNDHKVQQLLFSTENHNVADAVRASLSPAFSPTQIQGPVGSASKMYLVTRLASLIHVAAAAECYSLASARGVSVQLVQDLISGAAGSSFQFNQVFPMMLKRDFGYESASRGDKISRAMSDLRMLKSAIDCIKFPARLLDAASQIIESVDRKMGGDVSTAALISYWSATE